jgi:hypothetical protein
MTASLKRFKWFLFFPAFLFGVGWAVPLFAQFNGDGLRASYFDSPNFTSFAVSELDPNISYRWGTCPPQPGMPVSGFSVKWMGQIDPAYSEPYTIITDVTGGVSVIVNGNPVISNWVDGNYRGLSGYVTLTAGVKVPLEVDYFFGGAVTNISTIQLAWGSPSQADEIIPPSYLFSGNPIQPTPIPQTETACQSSPAVDGILNEWAWETPSSRDTVNKTVLGNTYGANAQFKTLWDENNLYVGVTVTDSQLTNPAPSPPWEGSMVEVYLDATHSRTVTVNSADFEFGFPWNSTTPWEINGRTTGVTMKTTTLATGYVVEASIPWATLGLTPSTGYTLGFDLGVDVNHNGGGCRDGQLMWNGGSDNYENTGHYGDLTLEAACPTPVSTPPATTGNPYVAPNPSNGTIVMFVYQMAGPGSADIKVWNSWGNLVAAIHDPKPAGQGSSELNVSKFGSGHYFYQVILDYDSGGQDKFRPELLAIKK